MLAFFMRGSGPSGRSRGQSLVEVIIASGIIMSAVASSLTLMISAIRSEKTAEAQITAGNLAREGIEVVRALRDGNWLAGNAFDLGLYSGTTDFTAAAVFNPATNVWSLDFAPNAIGTAATDKTLMYRYTTGTNQGLMVQGHVAAPSTEATSTIYRRLITLDPLCDDGAGGYTVSAGASCGAGVLKVGIRVSVLVQWVLAGTNRTMVVEERMMDWR